MKNKKNKISKFLIAFTFFFTSFGFSQEIVFESYGLMDKPLPRIVIKIREANHNIKMNGIEKRNGKTFYVAFVENMVFNSIKENVVKFNTKISYVPKSNYPYGTYKVTNKHSDSEMEFMLISSEKSLVFFKSILPLTKSNYDLYDEIAHLILRLE